jgi:hypothetical protein
VVEIAEPRVVRAAVGTTVPQGARRAWRRAAMFFVVLGTVQLAWLALLGYGIYALVG